MNEVLAYLFLVSFGGFTIWQIVRWIKLEIRLAKLEEEDDEEEQQ